MKPEFPAIAEALAQIGPDIEATEIEERVEPGASWKPVDLGEIIKSDRPRVQTEILERSDGVAIFYKGKLASIYGEAEAGKTWLVRAALASEILKGARVAVFDFEDDAQAFVENMLNLGLTAQQLVEQAVFIRPHEGLSPEAEAQMLAALDPAPSIVAIDGVTESFSLEGLDPYRGEDIATWTNKLARAIIRATGAAVVSIDHVVKDRESRGRWPIGGVHKLNSLDAAFRMDAVEEFGRGKDGVSNLWLAKDRPGYLKAYQDKDKIVGRVNFVSGDDGEIAISVDPPLTGDAGDWLPTRLMAKVSEYVVAHPGATQREIRAAVGGRDTYAAQAIGALVDAGNMRRERDGQAYRHHVVTPFSEDAE